MNYEKVNVLDDRFEIKDPLMKMYRGASDVALNTAPCIGGTPNNSQLQFNIPLTAGSWLDKYPVLHSIFTLDIPITVGGAPINADVAVFVPGVDVTMAPYPFITNIAGNTSLQFNTKQVCELDLSKYAKILLKLSQVEDNMKKALCPSCPENTFAVLDDAYLTQANPQATINDATTTYIPNGCWQFKAVTVYNVAGDANSGNNTAPAGGLAANAVSKIRVTCETYEPLILPPFVWDAGKDSSEAIFALNNLILTININQSRAFRALRLFAASKLATATALGVPTNLNITTSELIFKTFQTPYLRDFKIPSPFYSCHSWQFYSQYVSGSWSTTTGAIPTDSTNIHMSNFVSTGMPRLMILWCDQNDESYAQNEFKYYYPMKKLQIGLGNRQNLLANFGLQDLYNLSKDCGMNQSFLSYLGQAYAGNTAGAGVSASKQLVGGVVVLIPGVSFPLPADVATNSDGSYTFTFDATCTCYNVADVTANTKSTPNLNVLCIYDAWITIDTNNLQVNVVRNVLTKADVTGVGSSAPLVPEEVINDEVGGHMRALHHHDVNRHHSSKFSAPHKIHSRVKH